MNPLQRLARAYPRQSVPVETVSVYLDDLKDVPTALLDQAVTHLIRTSQWFPTISEVRAACAEIVLDLPTEAEAHAQIDARVAWARESPLEGAEKPPNVHPLAVEALHRVGGYATWRASDEPARVRGQFGRIFRELRAALILRAQLNNALEPSKSTTLEPTPSEAAVSHPRS